MADQALLPVPCCLDPMGLQSPEVIVRGWLGDLVTFAAGGLRMTDRAGLLILARKETVSLRPVGLMVRGRRFRIHIHMTCDAARGRPVRLVADLTFRLAIHQGNLHKLLVHQVPMTLFTAVGEQCRMDEDISLLLDRNLVRCSFQGVQGRLHVLDLMTLAAGALVHLLRVHPVAVAILARLMPGGGEMTVLHLPVAIRTGHSIVLDMKIVIEDQLGPLLITPGKKDRGDQQRYSGKYRLHIYHTVHNRTSMDARPRYPRSDELLSSSISPWSLKVSLRVTFHFILRK